MSIKVFLSVLMFVSVGLVLFFARDEIIQAVQIIGNTNIWILLLLIPSQFICYYAFGAIVFSYLKAQGGMPAIPRNQIARMALETNFVDQTLPSAGAAGFTYFNWMLGHHGVSIGRASMAQIVRLFVKFITFVVVLMIAVIVLALDHQMSRLIVAASIALAFIVIIATALAIQIISDKRRVHKFFRGITRFVNKVTRIITLRKTQQFISDEKLENFAIELHDDYLILRRDFKVLLRPFLWSLLYVVMNSVSLFIAFWAVGTPVNPAILFIAYNMASIIGGFMATPGGAGGYEATMIFFLVAAGIGADTAIAGTVLARILLLLGSISFGYLFYQSTVLKYGKSPIKRQ